MEKQYHSILSRVCILILCSACFITLVSSCATTKTSFSADKGGMQLTASSTLGTAPMNVSLTARLPKGLLGEFSPHKMILLWIERHPSGSEYRSREEYPIEEEAFKSDQYFYHDVELDEPGRYTFYLIIFPDDSQNKQFSNRVVVLARSILRDTQ